MTVNKVWAVESAYRKALMEGYKARSVLKKKAYQFSVEELKAQVAVIERADARVREKQKAYNEALGK